MIIHKHEITKVDMLFDVLVPYLEHLTLNNHVVLIVSDDYDLNTLISILRNKFSFLFRGKNLHIVKHNHFSYGSVNHIQSLFRGKHIDYALALDYDNFTLEQQQELKIQMMITKTTLVHISDKLRFN